MIHDLVLWPGSPPSDASAACRDHAERVIAHGLTWYREGTIPPQDPQLLAFSRDAVLQLLPASDRPGTPWRKPGVLGRLWGEVLTLELDGPRPHELAVLARLARAHDLVLLDLHAHRLLAPEDIRTTFGTEMIPVPRQAGPEDPATRCDSLLRACEELGAVLLQGADCSRAVDPFGVLPQVAPQSRPEQIIQDLELDTDLDLEELEELSWRLDDLIASVSEDDDW
jgi:hypothetical protein